MTPELGTTRTRVGPHDIFTRAAPAPAGGAPVVLVHGLVVAGRSVAPLARALAPHHPVLAPDLPGFGASSKPPRALDVPELAEALLAWLRAAAPARPALVGLSFGCQVLTELASRHPAAVGTLVLLSPTGDPDARGIAGLVWRDLLNIARETPRLVGLMAADYARAGLGRARRTLAMAAADKVEERLPRVRAPTLVLRGERDPLVTQAWAERVTRLLPDARLAVVPGAAHNLAYTAPDRVAALIRAFLADEGPVVREAA